MNDNQGSALAFSQAFKSMGWKGAQSDRYNAACMLGLAGNIDSVFYSLQRIIDKTYFADYERVLHTNCFKNRRKMIDGISRLNN